MGGGGKVGGGKGGGADEAAHPGGAGFSGPIAERGHNVLNTIEKDGPKVPYEQKWDWPPDGVNQSSPNHEAGAWNTELARAASAAEPVRIKAAAGTLRKAYWPREKARLWSHESMAGDNHTHQHLNGSSQGRLGAVTAEKLLDKAGGEYAQLADEILAETLGNIARNAAGLRAVATPFPQLYIGSFCTRCPEDPLFFAGTAWLRTFYGVETVDPEFIRKPEQWDDPYHNGPRALRYLQGEGGDHWLTAVAHSKGGMVREAGCNLKYDVTVYRLDGVEHLVVATEPKGDRRDSEQDVCDWFLAPHGARNFKAFMAGAKWGKNWKTPPPSPKRGSREIHFPAHDPYVLR